MPDPDDLSPALPDPSPGAPAPVHAAPTSRDHSTTTDPSPTGANSQIPLETLRPPTPPPSQPAHDPQPNSSGAGEKGKSKKARSDPGQRDAWVPMKLAIFFVFALAVWSFYVVVGRICAPMIQGKSDTGFGRSVGIGTLVGFVIAWLMFIWTYIVIITVPPGFAKDRVPRSPPPRQPTYSSIDGFNPHLAFEPQPQPQPQPQPYPQAQLESQPQLQPELPVESQSQLPVQPPPEAQIDSSAPDPSELAPAAHALTAAVQSANPTSSTTLAHGHDAPNLPNKTDEGNSANKGKKEKKGLKDPKDVWRPLPHVQVGPRWCQYCLIIKPDRTHHCRHCGTCVMEFDHHCLWIGQCIGWANHKYFVTFNFWAGIFTFYMFILLIVNTSRGHVDGEQVALIVLSGWFALFTLFLMFPSHVYLVSTGRTTLESYKGRDQSERENGTLSNEYGFWNFDKKRQVRLRWKKEWGGTKVDEQWRSGSMYELWTREMGKSPLEWILPIGKPQHDGINYPANPRFGPNGEWLRKCDWPKDIQ